MLKILIFLDVISQKKICIKPISPMDYQKKVAAVFHFIKNIISSIVTQ